MTEKTCSRCGKPKPISEFNLVTDTGSPRSHCKPCERETAKIRRRRRIANGWREPSGRHDYNNVAQQSQFVNALREFIGLDPIEYNHKHGCARCKRLGHACAAHDGPLAKRRAPQVTT